MQLLKPSLDSTRDVAQKNQQITVLVSARLRQSHERLKLDDLLRDALMARTKAFQQVGFDLHHSLRTVEVVVDVPLLVEANVRRTGLDWTFSIGSNLKVKLGMKNWIEHCILTIKASKSVSCGTFNDDR